MKDIIETNTGINIQDYSQGENTDLEFATSYFEKNQHKLVPVSGFYNKPDETFLTFKMPHEKLRVYFPGCNIVQKNTSKFRKIANIVLDNFELRENQKSVISQMMQVKGSEMFVNIPTATGKTVLGVYYISLNKMVTLIICPSATIMDQWIATLKKMGFDGRYMILGSRKELSDIYNDKINYEADVYLTTPMLLTTYGNKHGFEKLGKILEKLEIGIKIIDEAHRNLGATVRINAVTSMFKTIYLSADFYRASSYTRKQFFEVFYHVPIIKMDPDEMEQLKHINAIVYSYRTHPSMVQVATITSQGKYKWSHWAYAKYEFNQGTIIEKIDKIIDKIIASAENSNKPPYKILILTMMVEHTDMLYEHLLERYGSIRSVGKYHSKLTEEERYQGKQQSIIVATYQAFSTGVDIVMPNIQHVISTSPVDVITHNQSAGRCRPIEGEESYYWILEDIDFSFCSHNIDHAVKYLSKSRIKNIATVKEDE